MKTFLRPLAFVAVATVGLVAKPAQAQVSVGIATPGFAIGVGPGAGYVAGGYLPGYPVVIPPPIYAPRPVVLAPPVYARPYYGGYGYGYGRPHPGYGYGHGYGYGPHHGYPPHYRR